MAVKIKHRFLLFTCPACKHVFKWIDERYPTCCPECGKPADFKKHAEFESTAEVKY